jgi:hypothetical protein
MGVIFFIVNAAFALVLLIMLLVSSGFALFTKNPDTRYQPMRDDRGSFIKSQTALTTELDALGATARGEGKGTHPYTNLVLVSMTTTTSQLRSSNDNWRRRRVVSASIISRHHPEAPAPTLRTTHPRSMNVKVHHQ